MLSARIRRLLLRVALPLSVLVLLYAALGFWLVPRLVRSNATAFVQDHYHRQLTLGEVRFNPFSLRLDISGLALPDAAGQPMLGFEHLLVDLTVASIWHFAPDFEAILLEQPYANVVIKPDGSVNLSELALPPGPAPPPKENEKPARLFINHLGIHGGSVSLQDHAHASEFRAEIKPISFDLRNFTTAGAGRGTYALSGASEAGERFSWTGSLQTFPLASHGQFEIGNLQASTIGSYIRDSVHFEMPSGALSVKGEYNFSNATTPVTLGVNVHDITLSDLALRPKGSQDNYVRVNSLQIRETQADIPKHSVSIGNVLLNGGEIRAWVSPTGSVNLQELLAGQPTPEKASAANDTPPASSPPSSPAPGAPPASAPQTAPASASPAAAADAWTIAVPDIALQALKITAEDRMLKPAAELQLDDLNIHVTGYSTAKTNPVAVTVSTRLNHEGKLDARADLTPDLAALKGHVQLADFDLTALQPFIANETAMTLNSGALSAQLDLERGADGKLNAGGEADIRHLRTTDNVLKQDFFKFERMQLRGISYQSSPAALHIKSVTAQAPYARVIIESDRTINVKKVLETKDANQPLGAGDASGGSADAVAGAAALPAADKPASPASGEAAQGAGPTLAVGTPAAGEQLPNAQQEAEAERAGREANRQKAARRARQPARTAASGKKSGSAMDLAIDAINIADGSANYADFWIQPHFAVGIQGLQGSIKGLSSDPRARAKVELRGKVDRYAPVHIWGETNPLAATGFTDIKMDFKGVEMTTATPYSGHFAGYKIEKGKLSVEIGYRIENRKLSATHHMVIDQLELGDKVDSPDAVHLPLKIAVALLKDRNGVIDLNLPVSGSLDDPKFSLAPIIWKAVINLLVKIATAPFALLAHAFGGGDEMNFIDFAPGSAALDSAAQEKLGTLGKALHEKEKLELDVPVTVSADADRAGLAAARLDEQLRALQAKNHSGKQQDNADAALSDPQQRFHLLVTAFHAASRDAPLPDSAQAVEAALKKKAPPGDLDAANNDLQAALLPQISVPDGELEALGKQRAQAVQDVLVGGGQIDAARVFVIGSNNPKAPADKGKVRMELALK